MIEEIRELVKETCAAETNIHGYGSWSHHTVVVVDYGKKLARKMKADEDVVEIAALLHDYAGQLNADWVEDHHIHGAKLARELLWQYGYPEDKIANVVHCIESHRASKDIPRQTIEAKIVASADAMAHVAMTYELLHYAYAVKKMPVDDGAIWVLEKIQRSWQKLIPEAKEMMHDQYRAVVKVLNISKLRRDGEFTK